VETITKVVAGQTPEITEILAGIYGAANGNNIFKAASIKAAEASKVIENAQRDINVAFINEVTRIVNTMGLSVYDVLEAAGTKWNFLPFTPGLVGGHCIGVDPYYLARCAKDLGHNPEVILAGRNTNDAMGAYLAHRLVDMLGAGKKKILILGFTFKENINDIRNTKVIDIVHTLEKAGYAVDVHDPHARPKSVKRHYGIEILPTLPAAGGYDAAVLAVAHDSYRQMTGSSFGALLKPSGVLYDLKGIWRGKDIPPAITYRTV
jgi:UDP-N-acetyl-D-galactosamine dehydrogenase